MKDISDIGWSHEAEFKRRVGIIQSNYLPWRGYLDFIASCDVFVFHDDLQYTKQDWRNRNKVKTPDGRLEWITVPVKGITTSTTIDRAEIDYSQPWQWKHEQALAKSLSRAPHWRDAHELFSVAQHHYLTLSGLNQALLTAICGYLGIKTRLVDARSLGCIGKKTEKILAICQSLGADSYLSGPAARQYLDVDLLARNGIATEWKEYDYAPYPQQHGEFEGGVTVLDLIANVGKDARLYIPGCWGSGVRPNLCIEKLAL